MPVSLGLGTRERATKAWYYLIETLRVQTCPDNRYRECDPLLYHGIPADKGNGTVVKLVPSRGWRIVYMADLVREAGLN